jgi:AcrR family transcriptional regulator
MVPPDSAPQSTQPLFPPLSGGLKGLTPQSIGEHQRGRLEAAMVVAVARHGYAGTTLRELVKIAGVSKSTFYEHFESKQDCFLATFDAIISQTAERVAISYREEGDFREKLIAALRTFMDLVVQEPDAAAIAAVESLTLGAAGVAHRERGSEAFELLIRQSFESSPSRRRVSETTIRAIASGIRGVVYRHLRDGNVEQLPGLVEELVDWGLAYQRADGKTVKQGMAAAKKPRRLVSAEGRLPWDEPPDSKASRAQLTQRERILRSVGQLVASKGYETLSIPAISARAGTSNQTFYENFSNKREAFLATFDEIATEGLATTGAAIADEDEGASPRSAGAAIRAILDHVAFNELVARFTFFELQTAGPVALDRADAVMDSFTAMLQPGMTGNAKPPSKPVLDAVGSGCWSVIQHELATGNAESLPELAPELTRIVLAPFASD